MTPPPVAAPAAATPTNTRRLGPFSRLALGIMAVALLRVIWPHSWDWGPFRHLSGGWFLVITTVAVIAAMLGTFGRWVDGADCTRHQFCQGHPAQGKMFGAVMATALAVSMVLIAPGISFAKGSGSQPKVKVAPGPEARWVQNYPHCVDGYNLVLDNNEYKRLVSNGVSGTPEEVRDQVMNLAKHDPRILFVYYNATPSGSKDPLKDTGDLVENDRCYSVKGRDIYQRTLQSYNDATITPDTVPAVAVNTGADPGGGAFQTASGPIAGDRTGWKVSFRNGGEVWIKKNCGNVVKQGSIPNVPVKPETPGTTVPGAPGTTVPHTNTTVPHTNTTVPRTNTTVPHTTTVPEVGKDARRDVLVNPAVPEQVRGCGAAGCGGNTAGPPDPPASHTNPNPATGCAPSCPQPPGARPTPNFPPASETPPSNGPPPTELPPPPPG